MLTDADLDALLAAHCGRVGTHWDGCEREHPRCAVAVLVQEVRRLRAANLALAERLAACSAVLGKAAERGKVCGCQTTPEG